MNITITVTEKDFQEAVDRVQKVCIENDGEDAPIREVIEEAFQKTLQGQIDNIMEDPADYFFDWNILGSEFHDWLFSIAKRNKNASGIKVKDLGI